MAGTGKGYTTLFRELGTPEAEFHATFAAKIRKMRSAARRLARAYPGDPDIQRFLDELEEDRRELWEAWKRGALSPEMQAVVDSVRIAHHGPRVGPDLLRRRSVAGAQPPLPGLRTEVRPARRGRQFRSG
jgi:hypothetical protein